MASKYDLDVLPDQILTSKSEVPDDYHCKCEYCQMPFLGDVFSVAKNTYYSQAARNKYYPKKDVIKYPHNNPGHWIGYRYAIQQLTNPGDIVFDPTVGTGTAIVEAENNGRSGIGIELEFASTTRYNTGDRGVVLEGNALEINLDLPEESISLIINGTPYPVMTGASVSSDVPAHKGYTGYGDYRDSNNIGKWKLDEFTVRIHELYSRFIPFLKPGGYIVIIIKDLVQKKEPFNLHGLIADSILKNNPNMKAHGFFTHKHVPGTMFINTYQTLNGKPCPVLYQTGIVLRKDL